MMRIYHDSNGRILYTLISASGSTFPDGDFIEVEAADLGDLTGWRVVDGALVEAPGHAQAQLLRARAETCLDKGELLIRLVGAGILPPAEAEDAAMGIIPPSMEAMMTSLPPEVQTAARIKWRTDAEIGRTHPVIVSAAYAMGLSDEDVDAIFGVVAP